MNKRLLFIWFVLLGCTQIYAQENKETATQVVSHAQWSINHSYRVYQIALGLNDMDAAKGALLEILVEIPKNDSILFDLASIYFQTQNYVSAATCAQEVLKSMPNHLGALEISAISYENIGVNDRAVSSYEKLYLNTDDYATLYKTTLLQYDLKRYNEALVNVDILLSRKESDEAKLPLITTGNEQKEYIIRVVLLNLKGMIKLELGDKVAAEKSFKEAIALAPDFAGAVENLQALKK
ncbi:MAG: hypothetical protein OEW75_10400 [Cyclobacteriaceae bacterium]|nr:hypothetical protein [Cyclobacteriaceae bacterium]